LRERWLDGRKEGRKEERRGEGLGQEKCKEVNEAKGVGEERKEGREDFEKRKREKEGS
jgi:hypothetical protein